MCDNGEWFLERHHHSPRDELYVPNGDVEDDMLPLLFGDRKTVAVVDLEHDGVVKEIDDNWRTDGVCKLQYAFVGYTRFRIDLEAMISSSLFVLGRGEAKVVDLPE